MKASPQAQLKLLELADLDAEIGRLDHRRRTLPETQEYEQAQARDAELRSELATIEQVKGPVPEGSGSAMTTGPEAAGTVVEIGHATGMTCTVAVAGTLGVPYWSVMTKVYCTVPDAPGAGVNTIAPVVASIFAVPDGGAVPIAHVKGPEPECVAVPR